MKWTVPKVSSGDSHELTAWRCAFGGKKPARWHTQAITPLLNSVHNYTLLRAFSSSQICPGRRGLTGRSAMRWTASSRPLRHPDTAQACGGRWHFCHGNATRSQAQLFVRLVVINPFLHELLPYGDIPLRAHHIQAGGCTPREDELCCLRNKLVTALSKRMLLAFFTPKQVARIWKKHKTLKKYSKMKWHKPCKQKKGGSKPAQFPFKAFFLVKLSPHTRIHKRPVTQLSFWPLLTTKCF